MMTETGYSDRDGITLEYLQREHERVERERYNASSNVRLVAQLRAEIAALKLGLEEEKATNTQARAEIEVLKLQSEKEKKRETLSRSLVQIGSGA